MDKELPKYGYEVTEMATKPFPRIHCFMLSLMHFKLGNLLNMLSFIQFRLYTHAIPIHRIV